LKVLYKDKKTKDIFEDIKKATKYFGGNKAMAISLLARINAINQAEDIRDIIAQKQMRFHKLLNKGKERNLEGYFAIDVKTIRDEWRIILEPLDENEQPFVPCNIDEIAKYVRIVEIREVSNHYE
jgi:plasmid maintenance system killer protein